MTLFAIFPLLYVLSAAFNSTGTLVGSNALFSRIDFGNFVALFNDPSRPYARWFVNTMVVGVVTSAATVFLGAMAAYAFSRMRFKGRRIGLLSLLLLQMFPQLLAVVAIFLLLSGISEVIPALGLGSQLGLIMVYLGGALGVNTYLMYGFFNTVPQSLDEAAKIDGASHTQIFFGIIMRLVTPILAVVGLLSFIGISGEFVIASVVLTDPDSQTLAVGPVFLRGAAAVRELGRLRRRRRARRGARHGPVPLPAALHRQRPHPGLGEGLGMTGLGTQQGTVWPDQARWGRCRTTTGPACMPRSRRRSATRPCCGSGFPPAGDAPPGSGSVRSTTASPAMSPAQLGRGGRLGVVGGGHGGHQPGGPVPLPAGGPGWAHGARRRRARQRGRRDRGEGRPGAGELRYWSLNAQGSSAGTSPTTRTSG